MLLPRNQFLKTKLFPSGPLSLDFLISIYIWPLWIAISPTNSNYLPKEDLFVERSFRGDDVPSSFSSDLFQRYHPVVSSKRVKTTKVFLNHFEYLKWNFIFASCISVGKKKIKFLKKARICPIPGTLYSSINRQAPLFSKPAKFKKVKQAEFILQSSLRPTHRFYWRLNLRIFFKSSETVRPRLIHGTHIEAVSSVAFVDYEGTRLSKARLFFKKVLN